MEKIGVSVVVPTYRRPLLLARCLQALLLQDYPGTSFEVIVVSDGVDDETAAVIARFRSRATGHILYHALPVKGGPAAARNAGWKMASGELVAFTDDDCIPSVTWLRFLWRAYTPYAERPVAFTGNTIVPVPLRPTDYELNISQLAKAEFITANCACSRDALQRVNGFDERFSMAWREDSDLQFKLLENGVPIVPVKAAVVTHPVRRSPWGVSIREEKKNMFNALLRRKYPHLYRQKIGGGPSLLYYGIVVSLFCSLTFFLVGSPAAGFATLATWGLLTGYFTWKRLKRTVRSPSHIAEMVATSAVIPALSLYWNFYGAWKFRDFRVP